MESKRQMKTARRQRPTKDEWYLGIAEQVALRSTCLRRNFGAVIVKQDEIITVGYAATPRGTLTCIGIGFCYRSRVGARIGQDYELCRAVHAEQNAIVKASGRDTIDSTLYLVGLDDRTKERLLDVEPCTICKRSIVNAGIKRVVVCVGRSASKDYSVGEWIDDEYKMAMSHSKDSSKSLSKNRSSQKDVPVLDINVGSMSAESDTFKQRLQTLKAGNKDASAYQKFVIEILDFLFNPALVDGELEVKTIDGTERRDIIFENYSTDTFWSYLRTHHSSIFVMFETKNTTGIENIHFNQTSTYLGDRIGTLGFIITRNSLGKAQQRKAYAIYNDSHPRKIILVLSDLDLFNMLDMKCAGKDPTMYIKKLYKLFLTGVQ